MSEVPITGATYGEPAARARTRDFLLEEGKRPIPEILSSLDEAYTEFMESMRDVSSIQAAFQPVGEGEEAFSIAQVARHVAGSGLLMARRIRGMAQGTELPAGTGPGSFGEAETEDLEEIRKLLPAVRTSLHEAANALERSTAAKTMTHGSFGELDGRSYLRLVALHVEDHTRQVHAIKTEPDYPSSS